MQAVVKFAVQLGFMLAVGMALFLAALAVAIAIQMPPTALHL